MARPKPRRAPAHRTRVTHRPTDGLWALVLAGGDGTRLRELTRLISGAPIPKQYCRILGDRSLLEATLARVAPLVPRERTVVIVNRGHLELAWSQLAALPAQNLLVQPGNRDTGPGVLFSLLALARRQPDATVAVFPSDHHIGDERRFRAHVARMAQLVDEHPEKVALLGVEPDRLEGGFGYIVPGEQLRSAGGGEGAHVVSFHEKPTPSLAARIVGRGALWNSFVMVFRLSRMLELLHEVRPAGASRLARLLDDPDALVAAYPSIAPWNFSRDFLARIPEHLAVVRAADLGWSDWGTPAAIEQTLTAMGVFPPWQAPLRAAG